MEDDSLMEELTPFESRVQEILSDLQSTLYSKNADYGDSHAKLTEELGETVILVRLMDKLNRLKQLLLSEYQARVNESIEDTLKDLAGYAILELERRQRIVCSPLIKKGDLVK
jgi:hypothetical protein